MLPIAMESVDVANVPLGARHSHIIQLRIKSYKHALTALSSSRFDRYFPALWVAGSEGKAARLTFGEWESVFLSTCQIWNKVF
jgi:hypothetical protein